MVEEVSKAEKIERKKRRNTRLLWVIIALDIILFGYVAYEIIALIIKLVTK